MVRRLGLGKNNHLTYASLALNPRYDDVSQTRIISGTFSILGVTDDPLYTDTRYTDKIRYYDNLTVTKIRLSGNN